MNYHAASGRGINTKEIKKTKVLSYKLTLNWKISSMYLVLFIFIVTFGIAIFFAQVGVTINNRNAVSEGEFRWNKYYFISFVILTLFLGTRDGVGRDFYGYQDNYNYNGGKLFEFGKTAEFGYTWLTNILRNLNFDYSSLFLVTSFITILLLFKSFKNFYQLLPIGILMFFVGGTFVFIINGVRQGIAILALYNAIRYVGIEENIKNDLKNLYRFMFYITIGALFHYSILIFIPLFFLMHERFLSLFNSLILSIIIISGFFINASSFLNIYSKNLINIVGIFKNHSDLTTNIVEVGGFHIGAMVILLINLIPILLYNKISKTFPTSRRYFVLFAFGTGLMYAFSQFLLIGRVIIYLTCLNMFVYAFSYKYLKKQNKQKLIFVSINILIFLFLFVKFIYLMPQFMELQILKYDFSLWFIHLTK